MCLSLKHSVPLLSLETFHSHFYSAALVGNYCQASFPRFKERDTPSVENELATLRFGALTN